MVFFVGIGNLISRFLAVNCIPMTLSENWYKSDERVANDLLTELPNYQETLLERPQ
jgi:hypothetical protein